MEDKITEGVYNWEDYKYACYCNMEKPTWLGFAWHWTKYYWWAYVRGPLATRKCKKHGHDFEVTDMGGPESGPKIYADCLRCGYSVGPSYHG